MKLTGLFLRVGCRALELITFLRQESERNGHHQISHLCVANIMPFFLKDKADSFFDSDSFSKRGWLRNLMETSFHKYEK